GRLISLALRSGVPLMEVHRQLRGISSDRAVGLGPNKILSVPDAIGIALHDWFQAQQGVQQELIRQTPVGSAPAVEQVTVAHMAPGVTGEQLAFASLNEQMAQSFIGTCPD